MMDQFLLSFIMCVVFSTMLVVRSFVGQPTLSKADKIFIMVPGCMSLFYFMVMTSEQILLAALSI